MLRALVAVGILGTAVPSFARGPKPVAQAELSRRSAECEANHDGYAAYPCVDHGALLEMYGRVDEARARYEKACTSRGNVLGCAQRLRFNRPKLSPETQPWVGLYELPEQGYLLIFQEGQEGQDGQDGKGRLRVIMDTQWANGHECGYDGPATPHGDRLDLEIKDLPMPGEESPKKCQAWIAHTASGVKTDSTDACAHASQCGARGVFDVEFRKIEVKIPDPCEEGKIALAKRNFKAFSRGHNYAVAYQKLAPIAEKCGYKISRADFGKIFSDLSTALYHAGSGWKPTCLEVTAVDTTGFSPATIKVLKHNRSLCEKLKD